MSNIKTAQDYSVGELMAVAIARQMKGHDGDWAAVGAYSQLPAAGILFLVFDVSEVETFELQLQALTATNNVLVGAILKG